MAKSNEQFLRIGDDIFLFDEDSNVLVAENPLETRACARPTVSNHLSSESLGTCIFTIEPQQSHTETRALEMFLGDDEALDTLSSEGSPEELAELRQLQSKSRKERLQNDTEKRRLFGKPVLYGQVIQMYNSHFSKYLTVTGRTCKTDVSHLQVNLSKEIIGYFKIMPRYRIRVDGEPVRWGDTIAIQCVRPEGYLNVGTKPLHSDVHSTDYYEVYSHTRISSWTMKCHSSAAVNQDATKSKYINSAQLVRFYHKEMEAYLETPVLDRDDGDVRLKKHILNPLDPKESDSPLAFWEIENAKTNNGSKVRWKKSVRIRHAASRSYLYIDPNNVRIDMSTHKITFSLGLMKDPPCVDNNDATLFTLVPISEPTRSGVPFGSYIRIQHVLTKCWIHAAGDDEVQNVSSVPMPFTLAPDPLSHMQSKIPIPTLHSISKMNKPSVTSTTSRLATRNYTRYDSSMDGKSYSISHEQEEASGYHVTASQDFYYHDCFTITLVNDSLRDTFNYVNELLPRLQWYLRKERKPDPESEDIGEASNFPITRSEFDSITEILKELVRFCTDSKEADLVRRVGLPEEYHQSLIRDNGIIECVVNMIQIPFSLAKRYEMRNDGQSDNYKRREPASEDVVPIDTLFNPQESRLKTILTLCYNLLRVFLVGGSKYEESNEHVKNQLHVVKVAGDVGIELFVQHLAYQVGATDMMIKLLYDNNTIVERVSAFRPSVIQILINLGRKKMNAVIRGLQNSTPMLAEDDYESASIFDLLAAFCHTETRGLLVLNRDQILDQMFNLADPSRSFLEMRIPHDTGSVEIKFLNDEWRDLDILLYENLPTIRCFIQSLLNLVYSLSFGANTKYLDLIRLFIGKTVCLKCIGYVNLPCQIRAIFCDLLRVLYIDISPFSEVVLSDFTMQYNLLDDSNEYPSGGTGSVESKSPEFFDHLKHWTLVFLDDKSHQLTELKDEVAFLSSVLTLVKTQLRLGFFSEADDVKRLFRALVYVLDGRTDARNVDHLKVMTQSKEPRYWVERFLLTEENQGIMNAKIQILEIFDLIFDLRLHVRMSKLTHKWKIMETNTSSEPPFSLRTTLTTIFEETQLRQREKSLMPILKDILKYQYAPLKRIAVVVMHRIYNDCEDLFKKASQVLILNQTQQVLVYHGVKKRLTQLRSFLSVDRLSTHHLPHIEHVLTEFSSLFHGKTIDFNDQTCALENSQDQRNIYGKIFKNLKAHFVVVQLLRALRAPLIESQDMSDSEEEEDNDVRLRTLTACFDFLVEMTIDDKELQGPFVLKNIDLLIDASGFHPMLAKSLYKLCGNNLFISVRVREEHIKHMLEESQGHQSEYLRILHDFMKAQGKLIKKHQDCTMRLIMENRTLYVPFNTPQDLISSEHIDYCVELIELLSVCGQGDNSFGQSFARTIFSIQDVTAIIQDPSSPSTLKTAMLRFLASVYLDNTEVPSSVPVSDNKNIRTIMESAHNEMIKAKVNPTKDIMDYVYNGVLVFLRAVFEHHISVETAVDEALFLLCPRLVDLTVDLLTRAANDKHALQHTLACIDSMINVSGFRGSIDPEKLRDKLRDAITRLTGSTKQNIKPLDSMNAKFQGFIRALMAHNGVLQLQKEEFEKMCSHFSLVDANSEEDVKSLIDYLSMMMVSKSQDKTEHYQVSTIEILEEIPLRHIRNRSDKAMSSAVQAEALEAKKVLAQNTLNRLGCTLVAQNLLSSPRRQIFEAALKLLISLLEGGNKNVQDKLEEYFYSIREERFFYSFHQRLEDGIASLKEAQLHLIRTAYKMNRQQCILSLDTLENRSIKALKKSNGHRRHSSSIDISRNSHRKRIKQQTQTSTESALIYQKISTLMANETGEFGTANEDFEGMKDTMRALQLMVEGHNINLQTYLAKQPDNIKSFNIVQDVVEYLHAIVPLCSIQNVRLIIQVLDTITEMAQGCLENQVTIFNDKVINPFNTILREPYVSCPSSLVNELKCKVVVCLLSLLEGGIENSDTIFREMAASLDLSIVKRNMNTIYVNNVDNLEHPSVFDKLECGFLYCMLVMTLSPALDETQHSMFSGNVAFEYFQKNTGKIEVVMDYGQEKQLSRVLFPIPEVCNYLREDTKQRFLWNVKRDSPSAKIEDFVQQSSSIIYEIKYQARVASNKYLSLLTEYSSFWWQASYGVTIILNLLMLIYSSLLTQTEPGSRHVDHINTFRIFLGVIHLFLWVLSTAEFYFIQLPVLVNRHSSKSSDIQLDNLVTSDESVTEEEGSFFSELFSQRRFNLSFVLASISESQFLYHILMVGFSAIGLYYPGFHAIHLLDFVFRDRILQGVISSITLNVSSITRTALLGIIVVYIHSVVAYKYFRTEFDGTKGLFCGSLSECFVTILSHGIRSGGGIGDILEPNDLQPRGWRTVFEMSFYLVVVVFLLNAIFGIIFDTFGHLRDERSSVQQDMKNSCFICSIHAVEFQRHAKKGFEDHVKNDHNIWQYLFFIVHLKNKHRTEYTGPESYVAACLKDVNYSFFPINRALCLRYNEEDDTERLEKLEELTQKMIDKLGKVEEYIEKMSETQVRSRSNSLMVSPI
ncbi:IP3 receptor [Phycomyces blakesleeanus]|uniref:IP3 receptor n=2 Tax=Phycomyces blakesleeanus TaxID=4837 RepID=A0A162V9Q6_PHYB8|nr:IP3 receptor [Phycomyces blakesleeanus NRRL 1555(-)]OAD81113.1 IP3 receptor [Phycomyces blakesleeanus NRRL 1555(-)]|eukprot:XP_018299153.1 IP3 receptor [Phycomyces blakesleeanus NRRL 1555(-)]